ncbi:MAG: multiubiquitin domain-containing protein [Vicinamibacterales bacterium]
MSHEHAIHIFINKKQYDIHEHVQAGAALKQLAGIPAGDVLFRQRPGDDEVIADDAKVTLKNGDHFHSQPSADYGLGAAQLADAGLSPGRASLHVEPGGWEFLVVADYELPAGFQPNKVELLVKLPPGFPDAAPDMFWVHPPVRTASGSQPRATSIERLLGKEWQRFSWHLSGGAWTPGVSTLRDFMRCICGRFLRLD